MDEDPPSVLLKELWDAYVLNVPGLELKTQGGDRSLKAIEMLRLLQLGYNDVLQQKDKDGRMFFAERGRVVWQLLSLEFAGFLTDYGSSIELQSMERFSRREQMAAWAVLELYLRSGSPLHRSAVDPMPLLMPRWLAAALSDALGALGSGEVQPMLQPKRTGRHDDAWTWDRMRSRAVEHVEFLRGQGISAKAARGRVAAATGISPGTLRDWAAEPGFEFEMSNALAAGELKVTLEDNPNFAQGDGNAMDAHARAILDLFSSEPLHVFGQQYQSRFRKRHHHPPDAGN